MTAKVNAATRAYSTMSAPRPTPRRWATRVTSSGRSTPYTLAIRNSTNPIRLLACSRTDPDLGPAQPGDLGVGELAEVVRADVDPPRRRAHQAGQQRDERRLAGAILGK